jgi:hypothetical protein
VNDVFAPDQRKHVRWLKAVSNPDPIGICIDAVAATANTDPNTDVWQDVRLRIFYSELLREVFSHRVGHKPVSLPVEAKAKLVHQARARRPGIGQLHGKIRNIVILAPDRAGIFIYVIGFIVALCDSQRKTVLRSYIVIESTEDAGGWIRRQRYEEVVVGQTGSIRLRIKPLNGIRNGIDAGQRVVFESCSTGLPIHILKR